MEEGADYQLLFQAPLIPRALFEVYRGYQSSEHGLFSAPKCTDVYRNPRVSTQ